MESKSFLFFRGSIGGSEDAPRFVTMIVLGFSRKHGNDLIIWRPVQPWYIQSGPLLVINGVIIPKNGLINR